MVATDFVPYFLAGFPVELSKAVVREGRSSFHIGEQQQQQLWKTKRRGFRWPKTSGDVCMECGRLECYARDCAISIRLKNEDKGRPR